MLLNQDNDPRMGNVTGGGAAPPLETSLTRPKSASNEIRVVQNSL
jgi:hypothetical protein